MESLSPAFVIGLLRYIVFLFSTTCHEAAHAFASKLGGDETAAHGGQVTLNPLPHILREPFGMVVVPLLSMAMGGGLIGWASAPYDPLWAQRHPRRAAWMSLAGPAANFALAILAGIAMRIGLLMGSFHIPMQRTITHLVEGGQSGGVDGIATVLSIVFTLNILLGVFNLLPVPPLDGFNAIALLMTDSMAAGWNRIGMSIRQYSFIGLLVVWKIFPYLYGPVLMTALKVFFPNSGL